MWMRYVFFASASVWAGCTSASMATAAVDDPSGDDGAALEVASTVTDPGPRGGDRVAGGPFAGLSADEKTFFTEARDTFAEVDSVSGAIEEGKGLGPTFNGNSCAQCHAEPDVGGTSPHPTLGHIKVKNPQVDLATLDRVAGGNQQVPPFIQADGPIREAR